MLLDPAFLATVGTIFGIQQIVSTNKKYFEKLKKFINIDVFNIYIYITINTYINYYFHLLLCININCSWFFYENT